MAIVPWITAGVSAQSQANVNRPAARPGTKASSRAHGGAPVTLTPRVGIGHTGGKMKTIRDLNAPPHVVGQVEAIVVRGPSRERARRIPATIALAGIGLADDRLGQRGEAELSTRQVTLIQAEHLPVIARLARVDEVDPVGLRRNLVVSGINLLALKNARLSVGEALLEIVGPCQPCSRMEEAIGPGGYAAMRGHGGMTARVLSGGRIREGDPVQPGDPAGTAARAQAPRGSPAG
jgi:MOSC domain-containing protein YiiM